MSAIGYVGSDAPFSARTLAEFASIAGTEDPRWPHIAGSIDVTDLIERTLTRELGRDMAQLRGLRDGGYFEEDLRDAELREAYLSVEAYRQDRTPDLTDRFNFYAIYMANTLSIDEMASYVAHLRSPAEATSMRAFDAGNQALASGHRYHFARIIAPFWLAEDLAADAAEVEAQDGTKGVGD